MAGVFVKGMTKLTVMIYWTFLAMKHSQLAGGFVAKSLTSMNQYFCQDVMMTPELTRTSARTPCR
jgi:hypothetical protein